jgi:ribosome-binding factor A
VSRGRPRKVADLIQRELTDLLLREVRDPGIGMITITSVDVSPDLSHAKVFFTLLQPEQKASTEKALQRAAGYLRSQIAHRIKLYTSPELRFVYDESIERGDKLSQLIDEANRKT